MLPFLAYPRRYTQSDIVQSDLAFIEEKVREGKRWRTALALATFYIPVVVLILFVVPVNRFLVIAAIYFPLMLPHWIVSLRTVSLAAEVVERQRDTINSYDVYQFVLGKWWTVIRSRWKPHLVALALRGFAVIGLVMYFFVISYYQCLPGLNGFCYGYYYLSNITIQNLIQFALSNFPTVAISALFLLLFGAVELGASSLIGIIASLLRKNGVKTGMSARIIFAGMAVTLMLLGWAVVQGANRWALSQGHDSMYSNYYMENVSVPLKNTKLIVEALQTIFSAAIDAGTLNSAQFFRYDAAMIYYPLLTLPLNMSIVKAVIVSIAGLCVYVGLLWVGLQWAIQLALQRGAMPPKIR